MVEPVSLTVGAVVAALVVKAAETGGEKVVEGAASTLGRLVDWLRDRFQSEDNQEASTALTNLEEVPDSPSRVQALAEVLDRRAVESAEFRAELERWIREARRDGVEVKSISQTAVGDRNVQVADVEGSTVTVSYGSELPRRTDS